MSGKALTLACVAAVLAGAPIARGNIGIPASNDPAGSSFQSYHDQLTTYEWVIGSETDPIDVILDPKAGPWIKTLRGPDGGGFSADDTGYTAPSSFTLTEHLHVGGTIPWTDWHQEISTPGWYLRVFQVTANGQPIPGMELEYIDPVWPNSGGGADITFPAQQPCTNITIKKTLVWEGDPDVIGDLFFGTVTLKQYPTPEPATLGLLVLGVGALVRRRRRRSLTR